MCLGIVGKVVSFSEEIPDLASVDVAGMTRSINIALLVDEDVREGDWVLIHAGFAMEKIDEETAENQIAALRDYVGEPEDGEGGP